VRSKYQAVFIESAVKSLSDAQDWCKLPYWDKKGNMSQRSLLHLIDTMSEFSWCVVFYICIDVQSLSFSGKLRQGLMSLLCTIRHGSY
jgi:hypothetical protein